MYKNTKIIDYKNNLHPKLVITIYVLKKFYLDVIKIVLVHVFHVILKFICVK